MEKEEIKYLLFAHLCCLAKVSVPINKKRKLGLKIVDCVFLRYAFHNIGYMFLIINLEYQTYWLVQLWNPEMLCFLDEFPMKHTDDMSNNEPTIQHEHFISIEHTEESRIHNPVEYVNVSIRKSKRPRSAKSFGDDCIV
jgi:hypothetical protein